MEIDYKSILTGVLSKAYKLDDGKIAEILKEGEGVTNATIQTSILSEDAARAVILSTPKVGQTFQDGYAKAEKEIKSKQEAEIKTKYGIDSDKKGVDLIDEIITTKSKVSENPLDDETVKKHPVYVTLERDMKTKLKEKDDAIVEKENEFNNKVAKIETFTTVKNVAEGLFNGMKPVLPKDAKVAANWKAQFFKDLEGYDYEKLPDGSFVVSKDGTRLVDEHMHAKEFADIVRSAASNYFEFEANTGGANAGGNNDRDKIKPDITNIKTEADATAIALDKTLSVADRLKALDDYEKAGGI